MKKSINYLVLITTKKFLMQNRIWFAVLPTRFSNSCLNFLIRFSSFKNFQTLRVIQSYLTTKALNVTN